MNTKSLLMGIVTGGIAAAAATFLTAPAPGKETRNYVVENKDVWKKQVLELKEDVQSIAKSITELTKEGKETLPVFIKDIKILIQSWKEEISPNEEQLKDDLQSIQDTLQQLEASIDGKEK
jgi:gas vesicle protein